jgi:hypothetical protein
MILYFDYILVCVLSYKMIRLIIIFFKEYFLRLNCIIIIIIWYMHLIDFNISKLIIHFC